MAGRTVCLLLALLPAVLGDVAPTQQIKVLSPSGSVDIVQADSSLEYVDAPTLAPSTAASPNDTQADCISSTDTFWGEDFISTKRSNTSSASDCCTACKLANDCTVWNWCSKQEGCTLPPNSASATNESSVPFQTCLWKPRPITFAGTLPLPPEANTSTAMEGWTSGIPINGSLIPQVNGFELYTGIELDYNVENDFYCQGSTTTKPVCQLYGSAKGGAAACLNNDICRGYQICWSFPVWGSSYQQSAVIRMKAGLGPLNVSSGLQNPYCSVYVINEEIFDNPNGSDAQYALRSAYNGSAAEAYYQYASQNPNASANASLSSVLSSGIVDDSNTNRRHLLQTGGLAGQNLTLQGASQPPATSTSAAVPPSTSSTRTTGPSIVPSNFTTDYLKGTILQAYNNVTFNFTQCYSKAATIRVTLQSQLFPFEGTAPVFSIHSWIEQPFSSSATVCCAYEVFNDIFLSLETGEIATSPTTYVATNPQITSEGPLRNYDTTPITIVEDVVYVPQGLNNPGGEGRQYSFPAINSTEYVSALENLYFALSQTLLGDSLCSFGNPQLAPAVNFVGGLLSNYANDEGEEESPGGIPAGIAYLNASTLTGSQGPPVGCLTETGAEFDGDVLTTIKGNQTAASCCAACWFYVEAGLGDVNCDVWVLDTVAQSCELRNNTLAANFLPIDVRRDDTTINLVTGRTTGIQSQNSTAIFQAEVS